MVYVPALASSRRRYRGQGHNIPRPTAATPASAAPTILIVRAPAPFAVYTDGAGDMELAIAVRLEGLRVYEVAVVVRFWYPIDAVLR